MLGVRTAIVLFVPILATAFTLKERSDTRCDKVNRALMLYRDGYLYRLFGGPEEVHNSFIRQMIPYDITDDSVVHELACKIADAKSMSEIAEIVRPQYKITEQMFAQTVLKPIKEIGGSRGLQEYWNIIEMFMKWMNDTDFMEIANNYQDMPTFNLPLDMDDQKIKSALYKAIDEYGENFLSVATGSRSKETQITVARNDVPGIAAALRSSSSMEELSATLGLTDTQEASLNDFFYLLSAYENGWSNLSKAMDAMIEVVEIFESLGILELPW